MKNTMFSKIRYKRALIYSAVILSALLLILAVLVPVARLLIAFFLYTATLNSGLIPFPTMTATIYLGKNHSPLLVAAVGTAGSAIASIIIYYLLAKLSEKKYMNRIENTVLIRSWKTLARKFPFLSLVVFNAIPLPVDLSRFLAIFNRYSIARYVLAISVGRFVRYFLLAALGETFRISNNTLMALTVALIVASLLVKSVKKQIEMSSEITRKRKTDEERPEENKKFLLSQGKKSDKIAND